jgi:short-subunit dehydrogenase
MRVFLTGASSGLGEALARRWATPGAHLGLVARRREVLDTLADALRARGARVEVFAADVGDTDTMEAAAARFLDVAGGVDVVVANAGVGLPNRIRHGQARDVAALLRTNVIGVTNTLLPFVPTMIARGGGALVAIGSVSGFRALPGRTAYSASKAAVEVFVDGLRLDLAGTGVHAMTVCPGFVRTPLTARLKGALPFLVEADDAAARIDGAITRRVKTFTFPLGMRMASAVWCRLPESWLLRAIPPREEVDG